MALIAISIDDREIVRLKSNFGKIAAAVPAAIARGLNEGGDRVRTQVQRALRDQTQPLRYSSVTSRVRTIRAYGEASPKSGVGPIGAGSLAYTIVVKGGGMRPQEFPLRVVTGKGGGVLARLWGVWRQFKRSFQIKGRSGFAGLRARLSADREPIRSFDGPDLAKELLKDAPPAAFYAATDAYVPAAIIKHLGRAFARG